jgi:lysine-N-methylase
MCIGSQCEDTCCFGWRVNIDRATYRKYRRVTDPELRQELDSCIKRNRSQPGEQNYARIKMDRGKACPFLNEESLCRIQLRLGEEFLSDICVTYPRVANLVNNVLEKSATMSCPEAARLALLNPDEMEFDELTEPVETRNIIDKQIDTHGLAVARRAERYFWELRIFTIQVLQNRNYSLAERLIVLGMFYHRVQNQIEAGQVEEIPRIIALYTNLLAGNELRADLAAIPTQETIQLELMKELTDERVVKGVSSRTYLECYTQFLHGVQYIREATVEEIAARYQEAEETYYRPFMERHEYILENYLVNYVFKNLFPFSGEKNLFDNYIMMVVHYALIKMHLIGIGAFHRGLTEEVVIKLIYSFARVVEHSPQYLQHVLRLLKDNGYDTMAYMAILIKN